MSAKPEKDIQSLYLNDSSDTSLLPYHMILNYRILLHIFLKRIPKTIIRHITPTLFPRLSPQQFRTF